MYPFEKKAKGEEFFFDETTLDILLNQSNSKANTLGALQTSLDTGAQMCFNTASQEFYDATIDDILMSNTKIMGVSGNSLGSQLLSKNGPGKAGKQSANKFNQQGISEEDEFDQGDEYIDSLLNGLGKDSCRKLNFESMNYESCLSQQRDQASRDGKLADKALKKGEAMEEEHRGPAPFQSNLPEEEDFRDLENLDDIINKGSTVYDVNFDIAEDDLEEGSKIKLIDNFLEKSERKERNKNVAPSENTSKGALFFQEVPDNNENEKQSHSDSLLDDEEFMAHLMGDEQPSTGRREDEEKQMSEEARREYICRHFGFREIFCLNCAQALCAVCRSQHDSTHELKSQQFMSNKVESEAKKLFPNYSKLQEAMKKLHEAKIRAKFNEIVKIRRAKRAMLKFVNSYFKIVLNEFKDLFEANDSDLKQLETLNKLRGEVADLQVFSGIKRMMKFEEIENFHFKKYPEELNSSSERVAQLATEMREGKKPKVCFRPEYLSEIKENITHFLSLVIPQETHAYDKRVLIEQSLFENGDNASRHKMVIYSPEFKEVHIYDHSHLSLQAPRVIPFTHDSCIPFSSEILFAEEKNKIYFVSNSSLNSNKISMPMREIFSLDIEQQKLEVEGCMKYERHKAGVCMSGDFIYILGGAISGARIRTNLCERYNTNTRLLEKIPKMTGIRLCPAVSVFKHGGMDYLYVFGGLKDQETVDNSIEILNTQDLVWSREKVKNTYLYIPRHMHIALQINQEEILLLGGLSERNKLNRRQNVQIYNVRQRLITDFGDLLPLGVYSDFRVSKPVISSQGELIILNSLEAQIYPLAERRSYDYFFLKLGRNMRFRVTEIISSRRYN